MKINDIVQTPNGPGRAVSTYYLPGDDPLEPPSGVLIRHPKGAPIDPGMCAIPPISEGNVSGWLCVYKREKIT